MPNLQITVLDSIWKDDLFGRRAEADLLAGYIESVGRRPTLREDHRGFTIAVDADYGVGKSFFLRRLAQQLEHDHPVAFVDAWADDLADEPLTAIAATLKKALAPLIEKSPEVRTQWEVVSAKAGTVAKIVAKGLLKKGLGLLITSSAAELVDDVLTNVGDDRKEDLNDSVKDFSKDSIEGVAGAVGAKPPRKLMADQIAAFEDGQAAIRDLKESLAALVSQLPIEGRRAPIVIVIDELDRCRPTYAVKLLEETKHLFDVPGIVFVLGMNSNQLARSVAGAYGPEFDGSAYLRRFINRQYSVSLPDLEPLIEYLLREQRIDLRRLEFMPIAESGTKNHAPSPSKLIAKYLRAFGKTARDAFGVIETLQTCVALTGDRPLLMPYLLPLIIGKIDGKVSGTVGDPKTDFGFIFKMYASDLSGRENDVEPFAMFKELQARANWDIRQIHNSVNQGDQYSEILINQFQGGAQQHPLGMTAAYPRLLDTVSRFTVPDSEEASN